MSLYPFDVNGTNPTNLNINETHTVSAINGVDHAFIIPHNAPFFASSMVVVEQSTGSILKKGVDYELGHRFIDAVSNMAVELNGSIILLDVNRTGTFGLRYQSLGGDFVTATTQAITNGLITAAERTTIHWEDIVTPPSFPPTPHTLPVNNLEAVPELLDILVQISSAIQSRPDYINTEDIADLDSSFIQPMITGMNNIATAITTAVQNTQVYHETATLGNTPNDLGAMTNGQWVSTGLSVVPAITGTYEITWDINSEANITIANYEVQGRFLYNGAAIPKSTVNGAVLGLTKDVPITLQFRVYTQGLNSVDTISLSGTDFTTGLTIKKLSN